MLLVGVGQKQGHRNVASRGGAETGPPECC